MGDIVLADVELACDVVKREGVLKVTLNVGEDVLEKRELLRSAFLVILIVDDSVDGKDQVAQAQVARSVRPVALAGYLLKKTQKLGFHLVELCRRKVVDVFVKGLGLLDKIHVVHGLVHEALTALFADPENKPSVILGRIVHESVMHDPGRDYHKVALGHLVALHFVFSREDLHGDVAFDEKVALVVVMGMGTQGLKVPVGVVKDLEI